MKRLARIILLLLMLCMAPAVGASAQSASAKYDQGVASYRKGQYQKAIKLFNESMILNKSADNKSKCQAMVRKCNAAIQEKKKKDEQAAQQAAAKEPVTTDREALDFPNGRADAEIVEVRTPKEWTVALANPAAGDWWCEVEKRDDKSFKVKVAQSELTIPRAARIVITSAADNTVTKELWVTQGSGRKPQLTATPAVLNRLKGKGGSAEVVVNCLSDTVYDNGHNWQLVSHPDWVAVTIEKLSGAGQSGSYKLHVGVSPNPTPSEREGSMVLRSQGTEETVLVKQGKGRR